MSASELFLPSETRGKTGWSNVRQWLAHRFAGRARDPFALGLDAFVDVDALNRHFDTRRHAWADGRDNVPAPEAEIETGFQHRVTAAGAAALGRLRANVGAGVRDTLAPDYRRLVARSPEAWFRRLADTAERETADLCRAWGPRLAELACRERLRYRQFLYFRQTNALERDLPTPGKPRWVSLGVILGLWLLESLLNGLLLARVNEAGLSGGWVTAALLSLINVGIGLGTGYWLLRYAGHVSPWRHWPARIAAAGVVLLLLLLNLVIAVWRGLLEEALQQDAEIYPAFSEAAVAVFQGHLALGSLESLLLLAVGLLAAALAIIDGYEWLSDPYPGFSRVHRAWEDAQADYADGLAAFKQAMLSPPQRAEAAMDDLLARAMALSERYRLVISRARDLAHQIRTAVISVCVSYREENLRIRTAPLPAYMDLVPELPYENEVDDELHDTAERLDTWTLEIEDRLALAREDLAQRIGLRLQWIEEDFVPTVEGTATQLAEISERLLSATDINDKDLHTRESLLSRANPRFVPPAPASSDQDEQDPHNQSLH